MKLNALSLDIPAHPEVLARIDKLLTDDAEFSQIAKVIEADLALAAAVVKAVNSPFYGITGRAKTVHQAIAYLGAMEVRRITQALALTAAFPDAPHLTQLWARSARRAHVASRLARFASVSTDTAHTAGLFLEAGIAVLSQLPNYTTVLKGSTSRTDLTGAEAAAYGMTHCVVGKLLCERWGVEQAVAETVERGACLDSKVHLDALVQLTDSVLAGDLSDIERFAKLFGCAVDELRSAAVRLGSAT